MLDISRSNQYLISYLEEGPIERITRKLQNVCQSLVRDSLLILLNSPKQPIQVKNLCRYKFLKGDDQTSSKII